MIAIRDAEVDITCCRGGTHGVVGEMHVYLHTSRRCIVQSEWSTTRSADSACTAWPGIYDYSLSWFFAACSRRRGCGSAERFLSSPTKSSLRPRQQASHVARCLPAYSVHAKCKRLKNPRLVSLALAFPSRLLSFTLPPYKQRGLSLS